LVITDGQEEIVGRQLQEQNLQADLIMIEPLVKNTAISTIISAIEAKNRGYDTIILLPSDHYINYTASYFKTIDKCLKYVAKFGVCTIGIKADYVSTEYGYIQVSNMFSKDVYQTSSFIEKPTLQQAENYLEKGGYFWNSGIYIFNIDFILEQAKICRKDLLKDAYKALYYSTRKDNSIRLALEPYWPIIPLSLDYAIIKSIKQMIMVKANFLWQDIGSWYALWQIQNKDSSGNYCEGDVIKLNTSDSYIYSDNKLVVIIGMDNIVVVDTKDALLVSKKSETGKVKQVLQMIKKVN
jgi:mannose-1-phosphate guanylyltransferase